MFTSTSIQGVGRRGSTLNLIFPGLDQYAPFSSDDELWNAISLTLQRPTTKVFPQKALDNLRKCQPSCEPYVLTHCDLNTQKIVVKDGKLAGITDWEWAAYHPVWCEYFSASFWSSEDMWSEEDKEWGMLLQKRMRLHGEGFKDAEGFYDDLRSLRL